MILKTKTSDLDNTVGFVENYYVKPYGNRLTVRFVVGYRLEGDEGVIEEPKLFIGGEFESLAKRSMDVYGDVSEGVERYIDARKPLHSLVGDSIPIQVEIKKGYSEELIIRAKILGINSIEPDGRIVILVQSESEKLAESVKDFAERLMQTDCSRLSYYRTRLGL